VSRARHSIRSHIANDLRGSQRSSSPRVGRTSDEPDAQPERAVLVGVLLPNSRGDLNDPLGELASLAESAGSAVVDSMLQKRMSLTAATALGKGKLEELVERAAAAEADVVIFDNDLTPRQIRGLEKAVGRKVIDRSELILDIFASRAKTREAQLQVELAQLQYTSPRIRGMWTHLERIAGAGGGTSAGAVGGIGTRGPGERQIEIDRRIVNDRIAYLKREIAQIDRRKQREVRSRGDQFTVSLVGYTNSGKSTLMNRLTNSDRYAADQLFATLDTKTVRWKLGEGQSVLLSDTVGFVRDLPHHLVASFRATLEEAIHANLLLHVVDISAPAAWQQTESVDSVLSSLGCEAIPQITLLNKVDIANDTSTAELLSSHRLKVMRISAKTGAGLSELGAAVADRMRGDSVEAVLLIPHSEGKVLSEIDRLGEVQGRSYQAEGVELEVRMDRTQLSQLVGRHPAVTLLRSASDQKEILDDEIGS
jgi:GTP-binding protein HflX